MPRAGRRPPPARLLAALAGVLLLASGPRAPAAETDPVLYVDCRGAPNASPTVILQAGAFGTSADWDFVLGPLSAGGRVCAYDRAGLGRSSPRPGPADASAKARELADLLDQLGETGPVILVGHSNGALYNEAFARLWPGRVAGLVYINGVVSDARSDPRLLADLRAERRESNLAVTAGRLGLARLVAAQLAGPMRLAREADTRKRQALAALAQLKAARDEDRLIIPSLNAVSGLPETERRIPTAVIVSTYRPRDRLAQAWRAAEIGPAERAERSWILDMPGATHVSPLTRDRAYVTAAVDWLRSIAAEPQPAP